MFSTPVIYIQIHPGHLVARRLGGGSVRKDSPAFSHPRTLMGDFQAIEALFREVIQNLCSGGFLQPTPKVVVHLVPKADGGYTNVEERAFLEAAAGTGARLCRVVSGVQPLSDQQVIQALATRAGA